MSLSGKFFSLALGFLLLVNPLQATSSQYSIGGKYYQAFTLQKVNWYRAFQMCSVLGMQLATIENESDFSALKTSLFSESLLANNYWLAGNNLANKAEYVWLSSGRKFAYTQWAPSQPGTLANRCVRTDYNFNWVSDACNNANYFICSKPVEPYCGVYGQCSNGVSVLYD